MPASLNLIGARPARFRRERVLIVGCGDVGRRVLRRLPASVERLVLTSSPAKADALRALGARVLHGDLDAPRSLRRLAGLATRIIHLAPPDASSASAQDPRTRYLLNALANRSAPRSLVYGSTTGVYGDCKGARVSESRPTAAATARAQRRVDAEQQVRVAGRKGGMRASALRIPGIYASDREGGTPRERLLRGLPVLRSDEDVYTNHIHAEDLARACLAALWRGQPQRVYNVCDDTELQMGDYMDLAAGVFGLPLPPRVTRERAAQLLSPMQLSFMGESRRIDNHRMKTELRLRLLYPAVLEGLRG